MSKSKSFIWLVLFSFLITLLPVNLLSVASQTQVLKQGMSGNSVTQLQKDLKTLGYLSVSPTGYFGTLTEAAVKKLQGANGLEKDGIVGSQTSALISKLARAKTGTPTASRAVSSSSGTVLKEGMSGNSVTQLQTKLKKLGYLNVSPTGYYGSLTVGAVKKLQKAEGLEPDGVAGSKTLALIDRLSGSGSSRGSEVSVRSSGAKEDYLVSWYGGAENILTRGSTAEIYDIKSGRSFMIKRTYGYNHADCETLTAEDTKIMLDIFGGEWSWERRAIIVTVDGRKMAASMAGMPHAGTDNAAADTYVKWRSGGYGAGSNLDGVKNNNMHGVFDVHFLNSRTHGTNRVDTEHQKQVKVAADWIN